MERTPNSSESCFLPQKHFAVTVQYDVGYSGADFVFETSSETDIYQKRRGVWMLESCGWQLILMGGPLKSPRNAIFWVKHYNSFLFQIRLQYYGDGLGTCYSKIASKRYLCSWVLRTMASLVTVAHNSALRKFTSFEDFWSSKKRNTTSTTSTVTAERTIFEI